MQLKRIFHFPSTTTAALFFATLVSTNTPNTIQTQSNGAMAFSTCSSSVIRPDFVPKIADPDPDRVATIREYGAEVAPLEPLGAEIRGLDLKKMASKPPPQKVLDALQGEMAEHPATPNYNRHIFRLSNDRNHGILGVGPQWYVE